MGHGSDPGVDEAEVLRSPLTTAAGVVVEEATIGVEEVPSAVRVEKPFGQPHGCSPARVDHTIATPHHRRRGEIGSPASVPATPRAQ